MSPKPDDTDLEVRSTSRAGRLSPLDLEILAELDLNTRETDTEISRKINVTAPTVHSHIKELEESRVIRGYFTRIDFFRLGYICYRVYLKLNANREAENTVMDYLKNSPYTRWCSYASGKYDIAAMFWAQSNEQFNSFWNDFKMNYKHFIKEAVLVPYFGDVHSGLPFTKEMIVERSLSQVGGGSIFKTDETDKKILGMLAKDARASLTEIGKSTGLTPGAVKYRIDVLTQNKVIAGFRAFLDLEKLGYTCYKVDFNLSSMDKINELKTQLLHRPDISNIIWTAGWADIETCMCVKSPKDLHSALHEVKDAFPCIGNYDIFEIRDEIKSDYMPQF